MNPKFHHKNELAMAWINLSYVSNSLFSRSTKYILDSLNGQINFHTLTALMGPSGAGKTTLLKCINMRNNDGLTSDTKIFVNKYIPLRTCFIMQDSGEHLFMGLTVRESLLFASKIKNRRTTETQYRDNYAQTGNSLLCLDSCAENGSEISSSVETNCEPFDKNGNFDHNRNIGKILSELLLQDCATNLVNNCSGGEQKRLSVGLELVQQNKPNLLCIDEPTSGLDSNAAELVIQCLNQLAQSNQIAIVTSIHQPNSLLLTMFDQLYVMSKGGHCVFNGRPNQLREYLSKCGITCADDVLPIELLLKISSKLPNKTLRKGIEKVPKLKVCSTSTCTPFTKIRSDSDASVRTLVLETDEIDRLIETAYKNSSQIREECHIRGKLVSKKVNKQRCSFSLYHFYYLLLRGFTCLIRFQWRVSAALSVFSISIAFVLIYLYGSEIGEEDGCLDLFPTNQSTSMASSLAQALELLGQESKVTLNLKCQFFAIAFLQFVSMACTILVFPSEVRIFLNEHHNRWYSTSSYFWSKYVIEIPISVVLSYIYSFIIYYGTGQLDESYRFAYFTLITTCGMSIANSVGYLIGIIFARNFQVATTSGVAVFLVLVLMSGFFVPLTTLNVVIRGLTNLSFIKLTFESYLITIYGFERCDETKLAILLHQLDLNDDQLVENAYWILGHLVVWRLIALLLLILKANDFNISIFRRKQNFDSIDINSENKNITIVANYLES